MGWLSNLFDKIKGSQPVEFTFVPSIATKEVIPGINDDILKDECYIELYVESLRLDMAQKFGTTFQGVVYSFVTLSREGTNNAQLTAISKPEMLTKLDSKSVGKVIIVSKQLMGATAYRGGSVSLELGLFSVKVANLLSPILDYVTRVSSAAGISFVGAIKPFVPLITEGMGMIAGQQDDTKLEVGVDTNINLVKGCVMAVIAKPKAEIDASKLTFDKDSTLLLNGLPLNCGYAVFSIRATKQKSDYGEIPELKDKFSAITDAIKKDDAKGAEDALTVFRLATIASPDLTSTDAQSLVNLVTDKVNAAFHHGIHGKVIESLSDIGLYDKVSKTSVMSEVQTK